MADNRPKKSRKRRHPSPGIPAKRHQTDLPQASQSRHQPYIPPKELLRCLGLFLHQRCSKLNPSTILPIRWLRNIDTHLLISGYQSKKFLSSGSVVFLYMLCRDLISPEIDSMDELQASLLTCYYIAYCYIGIELGYPLKPFLKGGSRMAFWKRCISYTQIMSSKMLKINNDRQFYREVLAELKAMVTQDTTGDLEELGDLTSG